MFSRLSEQIQHAFKTLKGDTKISESNIINALRDIRVAFLEADVHFQVAKDFIAQVKEKALGESVLKSITPSQQIVKIFHDELVLLLGGDTVPLKINDSPNQRTRILVVGLNGAGKTTSSAKLAYFLKKRQNILFDMSITNLTNQPLLIPLDLNRPAAIQQLVSLAKGIEVPVFEPDQLDKNVLSVVKKSVDWALAQNGNIEIYDTAGRQDVDDKLINELLDIKNILSPDYILLVCDVATGQQAVSVAEKFHSRLAITGFILTKFDGDARGGAALSLRMRTSAPIQFIGTGEKIENFDIFHPERLAGRILGMGDVVGLVEKAAEMINEDEIAHLASKYEQSSFDLNDFLMQIQLMKRLGPLESLLSLLPGMSQDKLQNSNAEKDMKRIEAIIQSMTHKERINPQIINGHRRMRISKGSGTTMQDVNQLLLRFQNLKKLTKNKSKMKQLFSQFAEGMKETDKNNLSHY